MLVEFADNGDYQDLLERIHSVVFFGAPHRGLEIEALEELTRGKPSHGLVTDLGPSSTLLRDLSEKFPRASQHIKIVTCYELQSTPTAKSREGDPESWDRDGPPKMMVDSNSACLYSTNETRISIDKNHSMIAKLSRRDSAYVQLKDSLEDHVRHSHVILRGKLHRKAARHALRRLFEIGRSLAIIVDCIGHQNEREIAASLRSTNTFFNEFLQLLDSDMSTALLIYGQSSSRLMESLLTTIQELEGEYLSYESLHNDFRHGDRRAVCRPLSDAQSKLIASLRRPTQYTSLLWPQRLGRLKQLSESCVAKLDRLTGLALQGVDDMTLRQVKDMDPAKAVGFPRAALRAVALRAAQEKNQVDDPLPGTLVPSNLKSTPDIQCYIDDSRTPMPVIVESRKLSERPQDVDMTAAEAGRASQCAKSAKERIGKLTHILRCWRQMAEPDVLDQEAASDAEPKSCMLEALGYIEDHDKSTLSLLFVLPDLANTDPKGICTLKDKLNDRTYQPTLEQRFELARVVCTSIVSLHSWGWIHKDIRSENIMLVPRSPCEGNGNATTNKDDGFSAYLCGFDVARPETDFSDLTKTFELENNLYRHSERQQTPQRPASKLDDLYATGIVLLEIGIKKTMGMTVLPAIERAFETGTMPPRDRIAEKIRDLAAGSLPARMGTRYAEAVRRCLTGDFEVEYDDPAKTELSMAFQGMVLEAVEHGCQL